ncbi:MAG: hypothetical protein PHE27_03460 [Alphaproteobacteria bacterium]|nr:hypothetical protein [Alphaproteobacteria bacterium]
MSQNNWQKAFEREELQGIISLSHRDAQSKEIVEGLVKNDPKTLADAITLEQVTQLAFSREPEVRAWLLPLHVANKEKIESAFHSDAVRRDLASMFAYNPNQNDTAGVFQTVFAVDAIDAQGLKQIVDENEKQNRGRDYYPEKYEGCLEFIAAVAQRHPEMLSVIQDEAVHNVAVFALSSQREGHVNSEKLFGMLVEKTPERVLHCLSKRDISQISSIKDQRVDWLDPLLKVDTENVIRNASRENFIYIFADQAKFPLAKEVFPAALAKGLIDEACLKGMIARNEETGRSDERNYAEGLNWIAQTIEKTPSLVSAFSKEQIDAIARKSKRVENAGKVFDLLLAQAPAMTVDSLSSGAFSTIAFGADDVSKNRFDAMLKSDAQKNVVARFNDASLIEAVLYNPQDKAARLDSMIDNGLLDTAWFEQLSQANETENGQQYDRTKYNSCKKFIQDRFNRIADVASASLARPLSGSSLASKQDFTHG